MELRDLRYFETIAELQSVSAAAACLHRTQPALTASVRRLEEFCGATLFERAGRGIRLTTAGEALLEWARRLRLGVQDARREQVELGSGQAGHLRLGIVPTAAQYLLPAALQSLMARAPQVAVSSTVGLRETLTARLRAGELDLIVVSEHRLTDPEFLSDPVAEDRIVVVASASHPLFGDPEAAKSLRIADLGPYEWVLQPRGSPTREWIDDAFERQGCTHPSVRFESDMLPMLPALIDGTDLLGFVSSLHLQQGGPGTSLCELPVPGLTMRRRFVAAWRRAAYVPPAASLLVRFLADAGSGVSRKRN